jgi:hypothetical protein
MVRPDSKIPNNGPASYLWVSIDGDINLHIWSQLVSRILMLVALRPGITESALHFKLSSLVDPEELHLVMQWLMSVRSVCIGSHDGYWPEARWYSHVI